MPPSRDDSASVFDMLRYARIVRQLVAGRTLEEFRTNTEFRFAAERAIEIVGEAARGVTPEFQAAHPEVPWRRIIAQRHVLAHDYGDIDPGKMWRVVTLHIAELIEALEPLLPDPPPDPEPEEN